MTFGAFYLLMIAVAFPSILWTLNRLRRTVAHPTPIVLILAGLLALWWPIGLLWAVYAQVHQRTTRRQP